MDPGLEIRLDWDVRDTRVARLDGVVLQVLPVRTVSLDTGIDLCVRINATRRSVVCDCTRLRRLNERHGIIL